MKKTWHIAERISEDIIRENSSYDRLVLQLLFNRGIVSRDDIENFLHPSGELTDPFLFKQMEPAVELIIKHIKAHNKIVVYGDYDADGVTASALLYEVLNILKASTDVYIPSRVVEGYGLNNSAIDTIAANGVKLIITVDGGIRNQAEVKYANSLGIDVIITDHHMPPEDSSELPDCLIVNPNVDGEPYPEKALAGVGVAFKLAQAIISKTKLTDADKKRLKQRSLDLAAIGTVADCVPLAGENRLLVRKGLEILNKTKRIGLISLIKAAGMKNNRKIDAWNIGFQIGPRLNAAGRMEHANTAFELLITKHRKEAERLAARLNDSNIDRQRNTEEIMSMVEEQVSDDGNKIIIGVCKVADEKMDEVWNEGVIGLVAGRICEKYYKPALVITYSKEGYKGSGRSISEFNIISAVEKASSLLDKYGGHPAACGFNLPEKNLEKFKAIIIKEANKKLAKIKLSPKINIDAELGLEDVNGELLDTLSEFEPFGQGNERPKFAAFGVNIVDIMKMGIDGQHIKLRLRNSDSGIFSAIGFGQAEKWERLRIGDKIDIVYFAENNEFNGRSEIQLKIVDIKKDNE